MAIGIGIVLLVLGLILALDVVNLPDNVDRNLDSDALGWILIIAGVLALLLSLVINAQRQRQRTVVDDRRELPPQP